MTNRCVTYTLNIRLQQVTFVESSAKNDILTDILKLLSGRKLLADVQINAKVLSIMSDQFQV